MAGYLGNIPVPQATQTRDRFVATEGQTSFPTSGYTAGYLDVYLNGVKLDTTDYTATNGSDVVLVAAAVAGDILEVVAYSTFEVQGDINANSVTTGTFTSNGIDDNAVSTAMTLDASGNVLVGKTTNDNGATAGVEIEAGGQINASVSGTFHRFNRLDSDGEIISIRKDGTTVGSIGAFSTSVSFCGKDSGIYFNGSNINPTTGNPTVRTDGVLNIGQSTQRFKDLYLSGGVYVGGTGSANYLDDYEDGTFTPTISGGVEATTGSVLGSYLKIGNVVHIDINIYRPVDISSTTPIQIGNLPFTKENNGMTSHLNMALRYTNVTGYQIAGFAVSGGATSGKVRVFAEGSGTYTDLQHSAFTSSYSAIQISGSYICY